MNWVRNLRGQDDGVVLFNVLVIVAFMALVVMAMILMGDIAIARSQRFSEAGQATLFVTAGEQTALSVLQEDLASAPDTDHLREPWSQIAQERVQIEGGFFEVAIADAQGLYNLTNLRPATDFGTAPTDTRLLATLVADLDLPADLPERIRQRMAEDPPVTALSDLDAAQVATASEVAALAGVATVLPLPSTLNINTAPLPVLAALIGNAPQARILESIRSRKGFLTPADLSTARLLPDGRMGFTSAFFQVTVAVTVGQTEQIFTSLIHRDAKAANGRALRLVSRTRKVIALPNNPAADETSADVAPVSDRAPTTTPP
jgi:general secretion pathway protein K